MQQSSSAQSRQNSQKVKEGRAEKRPRRKPGRTDEEELWLRLEERHAGNGGLLDLSRIVEAIQYELETGGIPLRWFLQIDNRQTTAPDKIQNPTGYYRDLARKAVLIGEMSWHLDSTRQFGLKLDGGPLEPEERRIIPPEQPARRPACTTCQCLTSKGVHTGRVPGGGYCCCQTGRDLERAERRVTSYLAPAGAP